MGGGQRLHHHGLWADSPQVLGHLRDQLTWTTPGHTLVGLLSLLSSLHPLSFPTVATWALSQACSRPALLPSAPSGARDEVLGPMRFLGEALATSEVLGRGSPGWAKAGSVALETRLGPFVPRAAFMSPQILAGSLGHSTGTAAMVGIALHRRPTPASPFWPKSLTASGCPFLEQSSRVCPAALSMGCSWQAE